MRSVSLNLAAADFDRADFAAVAALEPHLVLAFFSPAAVRHPHLLGALQAACAHATLVGCSTSGEIGGAGVADGSLSLVALRLGSPDLRCASVAAETAADSTQAGHDLAAALAAPTLRAVLVLAPGDVFDGVALTDALAARFDPAVTLFGGLAGDGDTLVGGPAAGLGARRQADDSGASWTLLNRQLSRRHAVAVAWYGAHTRVAHGMHGGARAFGPVRRITRAEGVRVYELDGEPSLDIYRRYLGPYAAELPTSGLMFPFAMLDNELADVGLIRTLVDVDEEARALVLAGSVHPGDHLRLMHAGTDNLTRGAAAAAQDARLDAEGTLAIIVSCADRKMVMGERVADELEAVARALPPETALLGFYANGEIGRPRGAPRPCLNNQTLAVTCIAQ
jgi:hypothetical protein